MDNSEFHDCICRIMLQAFELRRQRKADVFVWYNPHVDHVDVRLFLGSWSREHGTPTSSWTLHPGDDATLEDVEVNLDRLLSQHVIESLVMALIGDPRFHDRHIIALNRAINELGNCYSLLTPSLEEAICKQMDESIREVLASAYSWKSPGHFLTAYLLADPNFPIQEFQTSVAS